MRTLRFWVTSGGVAVLVALVWGGAVPLVASLEPRAGLRFPEPDELWLLGVFTAGVLAVLLGLSVVAGGRLPGARAREAIARRFGARSGEGEPDEPGETGPDAGWWTVAVGAGLLAIYGMGWLLVR